jgi:hypothetical protein
VNNLLTQKFISKNFPLFDLKINVEMRLRVDRQAPSKAIDRTDDAIKFVT